MEDYKPNSRLSKEKKEEEQKPKEKKVEKVIQGTARQKKKSKVSSILADDVKNVKDYILLDVLVPAFKNAITDIVKNGCDMLIWGEVRHDKKKHCKTSRISYSDYYDRDRRDSRDYRSARSGYDFDDIILDTKAEGLEVLDSLEDVIEKYDQASVADLYDLVGLSGNYTDYKYGWKNLRSADVVRTRDGDYILKLPRAVALD